MEKEHLWYLIVKTAKYWLTYLSFSKQFSFFSVSVLSVLFCYHGVLVSLFSWLYELLQTCGMFDACKNKNPTSRHFSITHQIYPRIDFIFTDKRMLPLLMFLWIHIVIESCSDHCLLSKHTMTGDSTLDYWQKFVEFYQIYCFLETNCVPRMTHCNFWKMLKTKSYHTVQAWWNKKKLSGSIR